MTRNFISTARSEQSYKLYNGNLFPRKQFGDADAKIEWVHDLSQSYHTFVHTESYDIFKEKSALFILGRRGTGKTAMMRMLDYEISKNKNLSYSYSKIILQEEIFPKLTSSIRGEAFSNSSRDELRDMIKDKWDWIISTSAMIAVCRKEVVNGSSSESLKKVYKFLDSQNLLPDEHDFDLESPLLIAWNTLENELNQIDYNPVKVTLAVTRTMRGLFTPTFKEARKELMTFLSQTVRNVIILIDSKETYKYDDEKSDVVVSALMEAVLDVYARAPKTRIYAKVAFPSEMYPHFTTENKGKTVGKTHFIMWRYKDIISLIAKRYYNMLHESGVPNGKYGFRELDDFKKAKNFLSEIFPLRIETFSGISFDTMSYIIGHTQKKPRQIIQMFNILLTLAKKNNIPINNVSEICIKEGVNIKLEVLTEEAYDIYKDIFPDADKIIMKTFKNSINILKLNDIHLKLKESSDLIKRNNMDRERATRLFLECGIIGVLKSEEALLEKKSLIKAKFEYQIKDVITINNNDTLVIHPMFYQPLGILADNNSIVHPMPTEDEREEQELLV